MASRSRSHSSFTNRPAESSRAVVDARSLSEVDSCDTDAGQPDLPNADSGAGNTQDAPNRNGWGRSLKIVASLFIVYHLLAVLLPPLAFQSRSEFGSSAIVELLLAPVRGYGQFLYLDRGYAFFAPDPGPSHLIQARIGSENNEVTEIMYPDLERQWPRLAYHRHFMVAEFLNEIYHPPGPPADLAEQFPEDAKLWEISRQRYEQARNSIVSHLSRVNEGKEIEIRRIEHDIPGRVEFAENPIELSDVSLYRVLLDQNIYDGEQMQPNVPGEQMPPELIPAPDVEAGPMGLPQGLPGLGGRPLDSGMNSDASVHPGAVSGNAAPNHVVPDENQDLTETDPKQSRLGETSSVEAGSDQ